MARTGRPPEFENVAEFEQRLNRVDGGFFAWCEQENHLPLWEWFAVYMGCCTTTILEYMKKDGVKPDGSYDETQDFTGAIKKVGQQIMGYLVENGLLGRYRDAVTIFYMKNYGYSDKQEIDSNMTVTVQMASDFKDLAN